MEIIGVIDLKEGRAVHARGGRRGEYAAVSNAAGTVITGDALKLARVYLDTLGLTNIYIADLDAIAGSPANDDLICRICALGAHVLVDGGVATPADASRVAETGAHEVIVGLETLESFDVLRDICRHHQMTFSLDLRNGVPITSIKEMSPEDLARQAVDAGARAVIVLDLARVGGSAGPDVEMLTRIRGAVAGTALLAGGGVRGPDDLRTLCDVGCDGALVATSLHDGRLTKADVAAAEQMPCNEVASQRI